MSGETTGGGTPFTPSSNTSGITSQTPLGLGGAGSSVGALFGLPAEGSVSPQEAAWTGFTGGENVAANQFAFAPGTGQSTMGTQANVGAMAGDVLQTQRIDDAMKSASQQFANAQKGALGATLGGIGSALGGITKLAGGGI
jgi:hypothetical protein